MHLITETNCKEAQDAVRDILMMFADMAQSYAGFGHASDVFVRFDRLKFLDARAGASAGHVDLDLLHAGSAVAIVCFFYDLWCEEQRLDGQLARPYIDALESGRLAAFPQIESVLREAIIRQFVPLDDHWLDDAVAPIYREHVAGNFRRLATLDRYSG